MPSPRSSSTRSPSTGRCDYVADFAHRFPTTIFLQILGAPVDMLPTFLEWEAGIFQRDEDASPDGAITTMMQVMEYFAGLVGERRAARDEGATDIVSAAVDWEIDGEPVGDDDLLSCLLLLFMAGLDTVAAQLSYGMHHLASTPGDRERLVADCRARARRRRRGAAHLPDRADGPQGHHRHRVPRLPTACGRHGRVPAGVGQP